MPLWLSRLYCLHRAVEVMLPAAVLSDGQSDKYLVTPCTKCQWFSGPQLHNYLNLQTP